VVYIDGRRVHAFRCAAKMCKGKGIVRRYLDKGDRTSTSNMRKHAKGCWGDTVVADACEGGNTKETRESLKNGKMGVDGSITAVFERTGKGKVTYSHRQHTQTQTRYGFSCYHPAVAKIKLSLCVRRAEIVRWVAESMRPFTIVEDLGFKCLMKTGRPEKYIPSRVTVSRDVREVFKNARKRIAKTLQVGAMMLKYDPLTSTYLSCRNMREC
jgi:hypothetical protein